MAVLIMLSMLYYAISVRMARDLESQANFGMGSSVRPVLRT